MPIEYAASTTSISWLDGWPMQHQLWNNEGTPGGELDLVSSGRQLSFRLKNGVGDVVFSGNELQSNPPIQALHQQRGVVEVCLKGSHWLSIQSDSVYSAEILAYGAVKKTFPFRSKRPETSQTLLNGVELYGSPSALRATIGAIPGADTETTRDLSVGWTLNGQGYWVKTLDPGQVLYGLWVNGRHARQVPYSDLAIAGDRACALVGNTLYYKGSEVLTPSGCPLGIETAFSVNVLRSLMQATTEIEHQSGRTFSRKRFVREPYRTLQRQTQFFIRNYPVRGDQWLRIDNYSQGRSLSRRYTQTDVDNGTVHLDSASGTVTVSNQSWDYDDLSFTRGVNQFFPGENNTEITYTGGYEIPPFDIDEAACCLAAVRQGQFWQTALTQGADAISIGCVNLNFGEMISRWFPSWKETAQQAIAEHRALEIDNI